MFKKNWYLFTPLILIAIPALLMGYYMGVSGYNFENAKQATLHFAQSSTRYSQGFSEDQLTYVRPGMEGRKVFELLGMPFERHDNDAEWLYSLPTGATPYYHERLILFNRDNSGTLRVKEVVRRFHLPKEAAPSTPAPGK